MNLYKEKLKAYLAERPLRYSSDKAESFIEELHWYYMENNPGYSKSTRNLWREVDFCLEKLSMQEQDEAITAIAKLCMEHEKLGFQGGIRMGTQLMLDLQMDG